jgi:hypothetical protein
MPTKLVTLTTMLPPSQRAVRVNMRRAASATPTTTHIRLYTSIHVQHKVISSRNMRGGSDMTIYLFSKPILGSRFWRVTRLAQHLLLQQLENVLVSADS